MKLYSTNHNAPVTSLSDAVLRGLAPDKGLYMPDRIPVLPKDFFDGIHEMSFRDIALRVARELIGEEVGSKELTAMVDHTLRFDAPLATIEKNVSALELFHGPTMAFKDFGARFMSQLLAHVASEIKQEIVILVATSGDTGSAVANGFLGVPGIRVVVLYPSGKVSDIQEKQFTTLGENITALEVEGTFDDCQRLVKSAFLDAGLREQYFLTSANSINIARLIPQSFYYFYGYAQRPDKSLPVVISVPSGNFGNLTAGLIAKRMGLPVARFVAATNINDVVPEYLHTGTLTPRPSKQTISNAMDVGDPSNFARMMELYHNDVAAISKDVVGYAFTDEQNREAMRDVLHRHGYLLDPHGAIGYLGLQRFRRDFESHINGIFLETAHPAKFGEVVEKATGRKVEIPPALEKFARGVKRSIPVPADFAELKKILAG